ncbi:MAG: LacI family DNA-binding transcriptional regulator [Lachnospiraceae bacterium]|nr:LacI family transcriptional regulator [Robinsoniella sp.]MDY3765453.1 LacI family DNA-binding transcriptional regulator [Lachnospiraceae bacterium]
MNIYDIAELAGVSIATVSRVVNDSPKVSEKTKAKVRAVMEEQQYTPNVFARSLGLNSMQTVGVVCPDVSDVYMATCVAYLEKSIRSYGYNCILYCSGYEYADKENAIKQILEKRIDALVLVGSQYAGDGSESDTRYIREAAQKVPVFFIGGSIRCPGVYCVVADAYQAMYDVVSALTESGRKRILFLHDSNSYSAKQKLRGYEDALKDNGLPVLDELKIFAQNKIRKVYEILSEQKDLEFDAAVATDDGLAVGVLKYARSRNLSVPEDVNIIGYNNSELAICCEPELSSIDSRSDVLCKAAIDSMMRLLSGQPIRQKRVVSCRFVKRHTTNF